MDQAIYVDGLIIKFKTNRVDGGGGHRKVLFPGFGVLHFRGALVDVVGGCVIAGEAESSVAAAIEGDIIESFEI